MKPNLKIGEKTENKEISNLVRIQIDTNKKNVRANEQSIRKILNYDSSMCHSNPTLIEDHVQAGK